MIRRPPRSTLFPTRRSSDLGSASASAGAPISLEHAITYTWLAQGLFALLPWSGDPDVALAVRTRSEEHTSELQSQSNLVCRLLLEKKKLSSSPPCPGLQSNL